jgi:tetratricopeptide (TPR) repeat protein
MRSLLAVTLWSAIFAPALLSQAPTKVGIDRQTTIALNTIAQAGRQDLTKPDSVSVPWRSLSSEAADDPTLGAEISAHDAPKAARKAAGKAEHLSKKGQHEEAITEFRAALDIDPQYYEAENNLALELEAVGKAEEAEKTLRHLMESAPEHILAFTNLATLLCQQHRYADAEAVARQGLKRHRFSFKSNYLLGAALVDEGKWTDEAREKLKYAEAKYPEAKALLEKWPASAAHN